VNPVLSWIGGALARFLSAPRHVHSASVATPRDRLAACLQPGDVLLVEGASPISAAIKYLTQSTWSHVAIYVGPQAPGRLAEETHVFVEADLVEGVRSVGFEEFQGLPTRICRPVGLAPQETKALVDWLIAQIGHRYDLRNVIDLARYLMPTPPAPARFRRRMIALGSGDPTRAICSTLAAQAFGEIGYPILPEIDYRPAPTQDCPDCLAEVHHIRHHSLYAPRDFDVSPYFAVVKPTVERGFDFRALQWAAEGDPPSRTDGLSRRA